MGGPESAQRCCYWLNSLSIASISLLLIGEWRKDVPEKVHLIAERFRRMMCAKILAELVSVDLCQLGSAPEGACIAFKLLVLVFHPAHVGNASSLLALGFWAQIHTQKWKSSKVTDDGWI